jgi:hypothetical protein
MYLIFGHSLYNFDLRLGTETIFVEKGPIGSE